MKQSTASRRQFLKETGKASLALGLSASVLPTLAGSLAASEFEQQPLPYGYTALEPAIDALTMEIHYTKHAAAYAKSLAEACAAENVDTRNRSLSSVLKEVSKYTTKMRNNGGGHYNHEMFWQSMKPGGANTPTGALATAIDRSFGSLEAFKTQFADAAKGRFGSGWAWLIVNRDQQLAITSTPNQDNPLMDVAEVKGLPLLGLDVWEHAYYLKYQNRRPDYINAWWKTVNWDIVAKRMQP